MPGYQLAFVYLVGPREGNNFLAKSASWYRCQIPISGTKETFSPISDQVCFLAQGTTISTVRINLASEKTEPMFQQGTHLSFLSITVSAVPRMLQLGAQHTHTHESIYADTVLALSVADRLMSPNGPTSCPLHP